MTVQHNPQVYIKINGSDPPDGFNRNLSRVVVDDNLHLPDMFTLQIQDSGLEWVDSDRFQLGAEIEIGAKGEDDREEKLLIGEVTALEPEYPHGGVPTLIVRGYDRAHWLHRGKKTRTFNQMTDSDLASRIAQEAGLRSDVTSTSQVHEYIIQSNQTDFEFLDQRARRIGFDFHVDDRTLIFKEPEQNGTPIELQWGDRLQSFRPRLTTSGQVNEVIVRSWDPQQRQEIVGRATRGRGEPSTGESSGGGETAQQAFGSAGTLVVVDQPVHSQAEADTLAQSIADRVAGGFIQAQGSCRGEPRLRAGSRVRLSALGERFNGEYTITNSTHVFSAEEGYTTNFVIAGREAGTLTEMLNNRHNNQTQGAVVGIVTNIDDPQNQGRVRVRFPWLSGDEESAWARVASPMAGDGRGIFFLPEVNDEVLVAFEQGDMHKPYVIGALWNGNDSPPASDAISGGQVVKRLIKTRAGHTITLDDTSGSEKIILEDNQGNNVITFDSAGRKLTIESQGDIEIKSNMNVKIEATAKVEVKGATIELN